MSKTLTCPDCHQTFKGGGGFAAHRRWHERNDTTPAVAPATNHIPKAKAQTTLTLDSVVVIRRVKALAGEIGGMRKLREIVAELVEA